MAEDMGGGRDFKRSEGTENHGSRPNILAHMKQHKIDSLLLATRLLTIVFTINYILPVFGSKESAFARVLLIHGVTSALRLYQRLPAFALTREFVAHLLAEDSFHYLMYPIIVYSVQPILLILLPLVLFAILHAASYALKLLDVSGQNSWWGARLLDSLVKIQATNILRAVAFTEILVLVTCIIYTFLGRAGLVTPFMYYNFMIMRYSSRRNPYTRKAFTELRMFVESFASRSPRIIQRILFSGIAFVGRFAPPSSATAANQPMPKAK